jgi:hypothetical protein
MLSLKPHHSTSSDFINACINVISTIDTNVSSGLFRQFVSFFFNNLNFSYGTNSSLSIVDKTFIENIFKHLGGLNSYNFILDCCKLYKYSVTLYNLDPFLESLILDTGLKYVRPDEKINVANILKNNNLLKLEHCEYLYRYVREIGTNLYDFFHNLNDIRFIFYINIGDTFIKNGLTIENEFIGSQNVHKLDNLRETFLVWLLNNTFKHESKDITDILNNLLQVFYYNEPYFMNVLNHIKTITSMFNISMNDTITKKKTILYLSLEDILKRMIYFISKHKHRTEIKLRLLEEIKEMNGTCISGHINRIFNCLFGFEDIFEIPIEMKYKKMLKDELEFVVKNYDNVTESIIMSEWTDKSKKDCFKIANESREIVKTKLSFLNDNELFIDVVYKWSGLIIRCEFPI